MSATKSDENEIEIINLSCTRRSTGVEIFVKSEVFDSFFNTLAGGRTSRHEYFGQEVHPYVLPGTATEMLAGFTLADFGFDRLRSPLPTSQPGSRLNLSWLTLKGLGAGIKLHIPTILSEKTRDHFMKSTQVAAREFFDQFMRTDTSELVLVAYETVPNSDLHETRT